MKKINILGALMMLALMLGMVVPAQAASNMPFGEEQMKEIQEWAMSLGDEYECDTPLAVGQSVNFLLKFDGDIPDMPPAFKEIPLNFAVTGTEEVNGKPFYWLEIVVPDVDFEMTGAPSTYKLGLLVQDVPKEKQQELAMMQFKMQDDPMAGLEILKDMIAKIRFQQNEDPGVFVDLAAMWPMIEAQAPMMEEMMKEMEEEGAEDEMDNLDFDFQGDSGMKSVTTPAGTFKDTPWINIKMKITEKEEKESMDINFDGYYSEKIPILPLAKMTIGMVPHDIEDFDTPVTIIMEAQSVGSNAKTSFVGLDEFEDLGMMLGMMMGGMMGQMGEGM